MRALLARLSDGDGINPIVVKEVRQAVGGKFVSAVLLLFLTVQLFVLGSWLLFTNVDVSNFQAGRYAFMTLHAILLGTCLLFVPAYAGWRVASERANANVDLFYITTISPRKIIAGKFVSAMVIVMLIYCSCLPFLSMTYQLRGIDLPTIMVVLGLDLSVIAMSVMFSIWLGCIPASLVVRVLLSLMGLGILLWVFIGTVVQSFMMVERGAGSALGTADFWIEYAPYLIAMATVGGLFFVISIAAISSPTSNRAYIPRLYITVAWMATGTFAWLADLQSGNDHGINIWSWSWQMVLGIGLLVAISEREVLTPRLLQNVPRNPLLRSIAFLFYSGGASGVQWTLLMMIGTLGVCFGTSRVDFSTSHSGTVESLEALAPLTFYWVAYCITGLLVRRKLFSRLIRPGITFSVALVLMTVGTIVPFILILLLAPRKFESDEAGLWLITVPLADARNSHHYQSLAFSGVWAAFVTLVSIPWIRRSYATFHRPEVIALEPATDAAPPASTGGVPVSSAPVPAPQLAAAPDTPE